MKLEMRVRVLAGTLILGSLALAHWVSPWWLLLTAFVGVNLIQSAFTGFCPAEMILARIFPESAGGCGCGSAEKHSGSGKCC
jgi:hypothetical protein